MRGGRVHRGFFGCFALGCINAGKRSKIGIYRGEIGITEGKLRRHTKVYKVPGILEQKHEKKGEKIAESMPSAAQARP